MLSFEDILNTVLVFYYCCICLTNAQLLDIYNKIVQNARYMHQYYRPSTSKNI